MMRLVAVDRFMYTEHTASELGVYQRTISVLANTDQSVSLYYLVFLICACLLSNVYIYECACFAIFSYHIIAAAIYTYCSTCCFSKTVMNQPIPNTDHGYHLWPTKSTDFVGWSSI